MEEVSHAILRDAILIKVSGKLFYTFIIFNVLIYFAGVSKNAIKLSRIYKVKEIYIQRKLTLIYQKYE